MWPSLAVAIPVFLVGLAVNMTLRAVLAFFRATYVDYSGVVLCVVMMSISTLFYIIGGQYLVSKLLHLVPISGYDEGLDAAKFLILPVVIGIIGGSAQARAVSHDVRGGDGPGLRAHRARQGPARPP